MKKLFKTLAVIAALTLGFGFASCSFNGGGDGGSGSTSTSSSTATTTAGGTNATKTVLVKYTRNSITKGGEPKTETLIFYSDNTFALHQVSPNYDLDVCDGTYTDNPTKDGTVTATMKRMVNKLKMTAAFISMGMTGTVTNEHAPLEPCNEKPMTCKISGNNLDDGEDTPLTKVN